MTNYEGRLWRSREEVSINQPDKPLTERWRLVVSPNEGAATG